MAIPDGASSEDDTTDACKISYRPLRDPTGLGAGGGSGGDILHAGEREPHATFLQPRHTEKERLRQKSSQAGLPFERPNALVKMETFSLD